MISRKTRILGISGAVLLAYAIYYHDLLDRRFVGHHVLFSVVAAITIMVSGSLILSRKSVLCLYWAALSPLVASLAGYAAVVTELYLEGRLGSSGIKTSDLALASVVLSYAASKLWLVSVALLLICLVEKPWHGDR